MVISQNKLSVQRSIYGLAVIIAAIFLYHIGSIYTVFILMFIWATVGYLAGDSWPKSIFSVTYAFILLGLSEYMTNLYFIKDPYLSQTIQNHLIVFSIVYLILIGLFHCLLIRIKKRKQKKIALYLGIFILITGYSSMLMGVSLDNSSFLSQSHLLLLMIYGLITISFLFVYSNYGQNNHELNQKEKEIDHLKKYTLQLEQDYTNLNSFKHDYANILASLEGYIHGDNSQELKEFFFNELRTVSIPHLPYDSDLTPLSYLKIPAIKGLLVNKLVHLHERKISFNLEIKAEISQLHMETIDFIRLLGNLLDNAIEELESLEDGILTIAIFELGSSLHVIVKNPCKETIPHLSQLKEKGFSTKSKHRGFGLFNIEKLVERYSNVNLQTEIIDYQFVQHLIIRKERSDD